MFTNGGMIVFSTLKTLMVGANRRAETQVRQQFSIELIEEKIAQANDDLKSANHTGQPDPEGTRRRASDCNADNADQ